MHASISMPVVHPIYFGFVASFSPGGCVEIATDEYNAATLAGFEDTPIFYLLSSGEAHGRWRIDAGDSVHKFPILKKMALLGGTDHIVEMVHFPNERALRGMSVSLTSNSINGFVPEQILELQFLMPALGLACYRIIASKTSMDILAVYTGSRTSERILGGETRRGAGSKIYAAILLTDLRHFTALNETYNPHEVVKMLNDHFELVGKGVEENGGEILKFIGDSVLAIFPAFETDPTSACKQALSAAADIIEANRTLKLKSTAIKALHTDMDLALHLGEVFYGNIGARGRLDFTVIGKAVNEASRLEKLCDVLGSPLLLSDAFAEACGALVVSMGKHQIRGARESMEVFRLQE